MISPIILSGSNAFYNDKNYETNTKKDLENSKVLQTPHYKFETECKVMRIAKIIFAIIIAPVGIYWGLHALIGRIVVPSTWRSAGMNAPIHSVRKGFPDAIRDKQRRSLERAINLEKAIKARPDFFKNNLDKFQALIRDCRAHSDSKSGLKIKRVSIEVNGSLIDAVIIGNAKSLETNKRWILHSNGNGGLYEDYLTNNIYLEHKLEALGANCLLFNYPGAGASQGYATRPELRDAYRGMLKFLEDKNGLGASEIIAHGHSLGGGIQGEALNDHQLQNDIKYVFIKDRTFSDLSSVVSSLAGKVLAFLAKIFYWNMSSVDSSKKLKRPEIIIQADEGCQNQSGIWQQPGYDVMSQPSQVKDESIIKAQASLAKKVMECALDKSKKIFINARGYGHSEPHNWLDLKPHVDKALAMA